MTPSVRRLNRLLVLHYRSLPMYLSEAGLWSAPGDAELTRAVENIVFCQRTMAERIAEAILDRGGTIDSGSYPMEFTDTNFLALDFMLAEMLERQQRETGEIGRLAAALDDDPAAMELAQEALGEAKAHCDVLALHAAKVPA